MENLERRAQQVKQDHLWKQVQNIRIATQGTLPRKSDDEPPGQAAAPRAILPNHALAAPSMPLEPGTRLGSYEVVAKLGEGGMGEVYRARDLNLRRDVAIKILPAGAIADVAWRARFEREARLLASLAHPNVATVHRFEGDAAPPFLVMELVPGDTLAERLSRGAFVIDDTMQILRQCAAGLEAAHDAGIVHRDLKPANINITPDGTVKVLDFGLAKTMSEGREDGSRSTVTALHTQEGVVMGTAAYMSPEQARGQLVDRQTDMWAFGCIGYELLCGRRAFGGATVSDTIAAVLGAEPDWTAVPARVPPRLIEVLKRCLQKDQGRRLRDARDLRLAIEDLQTSSAAPANTTQARSTASVASVDRVALDARDRRARVGWLVGGLGLVAAGAIWWVDHRRPVEAPQWQQFLQLTDQAGVEDDPVISPDGASIAYVSRTRGSFDIFVQRVGGHNPIVVAADAARSERAPAFSPDGTRIAFHDSAGRGGIFVVGATGESLRRVTDFGFHPTWSPDGTRIAFCTEEAASTIARYTVSSLWIVDAKGGAPKKIYDGDAVQPAWSPSGARIAFAGFNTEAQRDLYTIDANGGSPVAITRDPAIDQHPAWSSDGRLYFSSDRGGVMNLWRVAIDDVSGQTQSAIESVTRGVVGATTNPSLSRDGSKLVFRSSVASINPAIAAIDLVSGKVGDAVPVLEQTGILRATDVSPDGKWLALTNQGEAQEDLFICRVDGTGLRRLTDDAFRDRAPTWSPDGQRLVFYSNRSGSGVEIWTIRSDGSGLTQVSDLKGRDLNFPWYSPAGDRIAATALTDRRVLMFDLSRPLPARSAVELSGLTQGDGWVAGRWSADGRWIMGNIGTDKGVGLYDLRASAIRYISGDGLAPVGWLPGSHEALLRSGLRLIVFDADSGQPRREMSLPDPKIAIGGQVFLSRDGKSLVLGLQRNEADIWLAQAR